MFHTYILRCANATYYVGSTSDLSGRVQAHNTGHGPQFTACRRPAVLVYSEQFATMEEARRREMQIKKWSRAKKDALIGGDIERLQKLSRSFQTQSGKTGRTSQAQQS